MMIAFGPFDPAPALEVLLNMRATDRREVFAARADDCPYALFSDLMAARHRMVWGEIGYDGDLLGLPVALIGVFQIAPRTGSAMMIATPALRPLQARAAARRVRAAVIPELMRIGFRRVDCQSWEAHRAAHAFLRWCGARPGEVRPLVGKAGEGFVEFTWLAPWFSGAESDREA
jgi:hypothetical protein